MNNVIVIGNLVKDIDLKYTGNNKEYLNNTVAVKREFKSSTGEYETDFFDLSVFGHQAKYLSNYGRKGSKVGIVGRLQQDKWEKDGVNRTKIKIIVNSVELLDPREKQEDSNSNFYDNAKPKNDVSDPFFSNNYKTIEVNDSDLPF